jgi:diguanylate cyclase (GGDEF)-like protein/PAS domain S-box-containing protein
MPALDVKTVMIGYVISNAVCAGVMYRLWRQNHSRFPGIGLWLVDFLMQFSALILILLRDAMPVAAVLLGNGILIGGTILLFAGLEQFVGKPGPQVQNALLLAAFLAVQAYFYFAVPNLNARNINISVSLLIICGQAAWLMLFRTPRELRPITSDVGTILAGFCLASLIRIFVDLFLPPASDFFKENLYDTLVLLAYQMLFIALTFSLFLMVNRRLFSDLERDIAVRREIEEALRISEDKFGKAFQSSPDAILISRLRDGHLLDINEGFCRLTGYSREEALAGSSIQLSLWADVRDRDQVLTALIAKHRVNNREYDFRTKTGELLHCLYSGELIELSGEPHIVSIVRDITEQKKTEAILRLRLNLWEYAAAHTVDELMQRALDEIEAITDSPISFYHFVLEDQVSLSLQAWSTRTRREFCHAEGQGMHYDLEQAGVWADCIREKKPIVHNDYAALLHRKGMPEGHARVVRQLVVPTFHGGRIVAVLGIGNKSSPYDERDIALLSFIADIIWRIIERKQTEEEIQRLHAQLREMALLDPLTGLYNRHYMDETLSRELARAAREDYPVSFVMIDIDHFKQVNDSIGHPAGDIVLQALAALLRKNTRGSDILYRIGGEEFLAVLPKARAEYALQAAEKWRMDFRDSVSKMASGGIQATISCGIASFPEDGEIAADLLASADQALYQAKAAGRDRSIILKKTA